MKVDSNAEAVVSDRLVSNITRETLEFCRDNNLFIDLSTGEINKHPWKKKYRILKNLKRDIYNLISGGEFYPPDFAFIFGSTPEKLISQIITNDLPRLKIREIYADKIKETSKQTMLERYGVTHNWAKGSLRDKLESKWVEKYGVDNPIKSPEIRKKSEKTMLTRYGSTTFAGTELHASKTKNTMLRKYGVTHNWAKGDLRDKLESKWVEKFGTHIPSLNPEIRNKVRGTNLERYGVHTTLMVPEVKEKIRRTMMERYGVEHPLQSPEIRAKTRSTNLERYGVEIPFQSPEIQEKVRSTNLERYGSISPFGSPEIQDKVRGANLERYGTLYPTQSREIRDKMCRTNLERYGTHKPGLDPNKGPELYERYQKRQEYREAKATGILNKEECKRWILGAKWSQSQELLLLKELCDKEPKEFSTELKIASLLDDLKVPYVRKAKKAHGVRNPDGNLIELDFWFPELKLGIEINGLAYHSVNKSPKGNPKEKGFHFEKFFAFHSSGIKMISFTDHDLKSKWDSVTNIIKHHLKLEGIQDSTLVDFPDLYRSFNYGLFDYQFPENPNFEDYCEAKFIDGWEYWDCGGIKES